MKSIDKEKEKKLVRDLKVLEEYKTGENKIIFIQEILNLCKSKKYIAHIDTRAISNAYFALSEKQTISLSKFLLQSLNKNTVYKHYPTLFHLDVAEQISFAK